MWDEIVKLALTNGLWAVLFVALLAYQLKDGKRRENNYVKTIEKLTGSDERLDRQTKAIDRLGAKTDHNGKGIVKVIEKADKIKEDTERIISELKKGDV